MMARAEEKSDSPPEKANGNGLYAKILRAQQNLHCIKPDKIVKDGPTKGHKYASKQHILATVRNAIHDAGLVIMVTDRERIDEKMDVPNKDGEAVQNIRVRLQLEFILFDPCTNEREKVRVWGDAMDRVSMCDQAVQKARTTATRLFYTDFFQVPVLEDVNDRPGMASKKQKDYINALYKKVNPSREVWGKMLNISPSYYNGPEDEWKEEVGSVFARLTADKASELIEKLKGMEQS